MKKLVIKNIDTTSLVVSLVDFSFLELALTKLELIEKLCIGRNEYLEQLLSLIIPNLDNLISSFEEYENQDTDHDICLIVSEGLKHENNSGNTNIGVQTVSDKMS